MLSKTFVRAFLAFASATVLLLLAPTAHAQDNKIMGQIDFQATTKPEKMPVFGSMANTSDT